MDMKIGELAQRADCQTVTIRYYEREGLLPPPARSEGNYRLYNDEHVERLSFIRRCRSLDMTLGEICMLLCFRDAPEQNCDAVNNLLDTHIGHVALRIVELKALEQQLKNLRMGCADAQQARNCCIVKEPAIETKPARDKLKRKRSMSAQDHASDTARKQQ